MDDSTEYEIPLSGGRTRSGVVRVGDTVRRPLVAQSPFVHELLRHLEAKGFPGAPRFLGEDERGREILSYLPGIVPPCLHDFRDDIVTAGAHLLRALHDATADSPLTNGSEIVCHGDPSPCNCAFIDDVPTGFFDFDLACPGSRRDDVGSAAWLWVNLGDDKIPARHQGRRLAMFYAAYGKAEVSEAIPAIIESQERLAARLGNLPRDLLWTESRRRWVETHRSELLEGIALAGTGR